jgi:DNA-binding FrmR family transcriptional regulator
MGLVSLRITGANCRQDRWLLPHRSVPYGGITDTEGTMYGYIEHKEQVSKRLRRIEGQVRGLQQMIEDDRYCIDILTQISAATKALQAVAVELMGDHLRSCVSEAVQAGGAWGPRRRSPKRPTPSPDSCAPERTVRSISSLSYPGRYVARFVNSAQRGGLLRGHQIVDKVVQPRPETLWVPKTPIGLLNRIF